MVLFAAATLPTRRLRFELRFPRGLWPRRHVAGCSPAVMLPLKEGVEDLRERLYPDGWRLEEDVGAGVLSLVVERPLPGVTHAIGLWPLVPVGRPPRAAGTLGAAP